MNELWVNAVITAQKGQAIAEIKAALEHLRQATLAEDGCLRFEILQHKASPESFTLWEGWKNEQALHDHFQAPHTLAYLDKKFTEVVNIEKLFSPINSSTL